MGFSGYRKFNKLDVDCNNEESDILIFIGLEFDKAIFKPLKEASAEEAKQALADGEMGRLEVAENGFALVKLSEQLKEDLASAGVNSVEIREPSGTVRTYTSFKFQALSDRELNLLITQTKAYIVFLKTKDDQSDKKTEKKILDLEIRSRYLQIERAVRTNHPELKYLLEGLLKTSPYRVSNI